MSLSIGKKMSLLSAIFAAILLILMSISTYFLKQAFTHGGQNSETIDLSRSMQVEFKIQVQEWKNTLLRGSDPEAFAKYWESFNLSKTKVYESFDELEKVFSEQELSTQSVVDARAAYRTMMTKYEEAIKLYNSSDMNSALIVDKAVKGVDREPNRLMDEIVQGYKAHADEDYRAKMTFDTLVLGVIFVLSLLGSAIGLYLTYRSIMAPLQSLKSTFSSSTRVVRESTLQMEQAVSSMVAASEETSAQSALVKKSSAHASGYVQDVSKAVRELNESIRDIANNASASTDIVEDTVRLAKKTDEVVMRLDETSKKISEVVNLINELASQTNLLALNAAIEAARAGDAGRGFAVVADEVKKLAGNTGNATVDIAEHVQTIQSVSQSCVRSLHDVVTSINNIKDNAASVSAAVEQQGSVASHIASSIQDAAVRVQEVDQNMVGIEQAANDTGLSADQVHRAVTDLNATFQSLELEMASTLRKIGVR